ncbi:61be4608-b7e5-47e1-b1ac-81b29636e3d3-CDS [Sclerotinia trifoliorum]|uniref:61be4608-b7e5-47e1-b1ac-81b29636e3d3-CDS n=1 Tax=Sclerotinia trifoliorum TaxID=28548 RepID=A0A8H2W594_9HELO|nr:61be4608-b7e5-47e1-b1ac-81b29636e3d3-CDS [Sclerotinia trifoliorum]
MSLPGRSNSIRDSDHRAERSVSVLEGLTDLGMGFDSMSFLIRESATGYQNQGQNQPAGDLDGDLDANNEHEHEHEQRGRLRTRSRDFSSSPHFLLPPNTINNSSLNPFSPDQNPTPSIAAAPPLPNSQVQQELTNGSVGIESLPTETQNSPFTRQVLRPIPTFGPESWNEFASEARECSTSPLARSNVTDALIRLQRDISRVREEVHRTAETRSVSPSSETGGIWLIEGEDDGEEAWSPSTWVDHHDVQPVPAIEEEVSTLQTDTRDNESNPETDSSRNVSLRERRDISPHPHQHSISDFVNEIAIIVEARNRAAAERIEDEIARMQWAARPPTSNRSIFPHEGNVGNASRSTPRVPDQMSRESSNDMSGTMNFLTRTPRLQPSTSYENLRLERQLAALLPFETQNYGTSQMAAAPREHLSHSQWNPTDSEPDPDANISPPSRVPGALSMNSQTIAPDTETSSPHSMSRSHISHRNHRSPSHEQSISPTAEQQFDAMRLNRIPSRTPITAHDHLASWQSHLERSTWRKDFWLSEQWLHRRGRYTLIPPVSSSISIEDVSGTTRSDAEILTAYLLSASDGVKEILRLVVEDGMPVREAWHYLILWQGFILDWPVNKYHDEHGLVPMDLVMIMQGLDKGWGDWKMSRKCRSECSEYLVKRTNYYPFPSAEFLTAGANLEVVTAQSLRDYFGSRLGLLDEEWNSLALLRDKNYSTARILRLATNFALACVKVKTVKLKPPFDDSENAKRREIFERLKVEELLLAGPDGALTVREY